MSDQFDEQANDLIDQLHHRAHDHEPLTWGDARLVVAAVLRAALHPLSIAARADAVRLAREPRADGVGEFSEAEIDRMADEWNQHINGPGATMVTRTFIAAVLGGYTRGVNPDLIAFVRAKAADLRACKAPVEPATFPREPRDEEEREACDYFTEARMFTNLCGVEHARRFACTRKPRHSGDHVDATIWPDGVPQIGARWPSSPAPEPAPAPDVAGEVASTDDWRARAEAEVQAGYDGEPMPGGGRRSALYGYGCAIRQAERWAEQAEKQRDDEHEMRVDAYHRNLADHDKLARALADEQAAHAETRENLAERTRERDEAGRETFTSAAQRDAARAALATRDAELAQARADLARAAGERAEALAEARRAALDEAIAIAEKDCAHHVRNVLVTLRDGAPPPGAATTEETR